VGGLVVAPLDGERRGVYADLDRCRPVGVHLAVFVVVALKLQLQVRSARTRKGRIFMSECDGVSRGDRKDKPQSDVCSLSNLLISPKASRPPVMGRNNSHCKTLNKLQMGEWLWLERGRNGNYNNLNQRKFMDDWPLWAFDLFKIIVSGRRNDCTSFFNQLAKG